MTSAMRAASQSAALLGSRGYLGSRFWTMPISPSKPPHGRRRQLGVGHHHVVHELEGLVQAVLLAVRPVADDKAALGGCGNLVKREPVLDLGELGKAELGVLDKGVDRRARQEALAAVLVKGLRCIKVIERDIGDNAGLIAGGKELVIEGNTLGVNLTSAVGEDTAPSDGDTDTVDAEALAQVDIDRVLVVEIACGSGEKRP